MRAAAEATRRNVQADACVLRAQGKDSIRYLQEHDVMPEVYEAIGQFAKGARCRRRLHTTRPARLRADAPLQARARTRTCLIG